MNDNLTARANLKDILQSPEVTFAMEAHDGMSSRIAQDAGFPVLWASGLCVSTAFGVRDANELAWSDMLRQVHNMSLCTDLPILVDGDSGHGNYNSTRLFARNAQAAGAQGVSFEDKRFPKMNSFYGDEHDLVDKREFMVKVAAARESVGNEFCIVARTEALVAGVGMDEALSRAAAYVEAGADAVFIHSRRPEPDEIVEFCRLWENRAPLVLAPTTYGKNLSREFYESLGISLVLWANHSLRAAYRAIQGVTNHLSRHQSLIGIPPMASVSEIFDHYDYSEMDIAEQRLIQLVQSEMLPPEARETASAEVVER